jgi:site-specific recombinase XerC
LFTTILEEILINWWIDLVLAGLMTFHCFRRSFAKKFVRSRGDLFCLQKLLGYTTLTMSRRYVELEIEGLQKEQHRTSLLNRLP